jgi:3'5'-cyclic nucleotide phosphodiesterase
MTTFWLDCEGKSDSRSASSSDAARPRFDKIAAEASNEGVIDWVCDTLLEPLKLVINGQQSTKKKNSEDLIYKRAEGKTFLDETEEVITLPDFDATAITVSVTEDEGGTRDDSIWYNEVKKQLRMLVKAIATMYNNNPFHNFDHACHVTMSVSKVLKQIITPDLDVEDMKGVKSLEAHLHDYTFGITSDPLAVLAIIFSALIHDIDHRGVSNMQLIKEEPGMASMYQNQSVAEQNSLELAWNMLMEDEYATLREAMFATRDDMMRFRQVMINVVLATDIFDKTQNDKRRARWQKAFHDDQVPKQELYALRATIVIEHIVQASDVAHTMQHWHIYQKWNRRLFLEMTNAYRSGRMSADPASFWYQGELGFFDNYIIPLAKKLKDCGVFGVSSDEFLTYAEQNRLEWAERGQEIVSTLSYEVAIQEGIDLQEEDDVFEHSRTQSGE